MGTVLKTAGPERVADVPMWVVLGGGSEWPLQIASVPSRSASWRRDLVAPFSSIPLIRSIFSLRGNRFSTSMPMKVSGLGRGVLG